MSLNVITIDFWNTLFDSSNGIERNRIRNTAIKKAVDKLNFELSDKALKDAIGMAWGHFNEIWIKEMRTPLPRESVEYFWNVLQIPDDENAKVEVVKSFETALLECPPKLMQDAAYTLSKLKKDYKLAIISDTGFTPGRILRTVLETSGILDFFDAFSFSDETGVSKPHPKAYQTILDELNCMPENALHIGDIEKTDIEGAKQLGMKAIRFSGDPSYLTKPNSKKTAGDAEVFTWNDALLAIRRLDSDLF